MINESYFLLCIGVNPNSNSINNYYRCNFTPDITRSITADNELKDTMFISKRERYDTKWGLIGYQSLW